MSIIKPESISPADDHVAPLVAAPRRKEVDLRLVPMGFAALILVGACLLLLPWAHRPGHSPGWLDALFLSTSATCVTGLTTVNVAETFNGFGQAVLLGLVQAGGLGLFTGSILLVLASGNRLSLSDEQTIHTTVGRLRQARPLDVFIYACVFVVVFELAGAGFARTQAQIARYLPPIVEAFGITPFAVDELFGQLAQAFGTGVGGFGFRSLWSVPGPVGSKRWRRFAAASTGWPARRGFQV